MKTRVFLLIACLLLVGLNTMVIVENRSLRRELTETIDANACVKITYRAKDVTQLRAALRDAAQDVGADGLALIGVDASDGFFRGLTQADLAKCH